MCFSSNSLFNLFLFLFPLSYNLIVIVQQVKHNLDWKFNFLKYQMKFRSSFYMKQLNQGIRRKQNLYNFEKKKNVRRTVDYAKVILSKYIYLNI